jgi:peptide deformylase
MNQQINPLEIIEPHKILSREVTGDEVDRIYKDSEAIFPLLNKKHGLYNSATAIAHMQVTTDDPIRFFVLNPAFFADIAEIVIINPEIVKHTNNTIDSEEGCISFPNAPQTIVQRWNKCVVEFNVLEFTEDKKPKMSDRRRENISGKLAKTFQHEIDHFFGISIYDK